MLPNWVIVLLALFCIHGLVDMTMFLLRRLSRDDNER